MDYLDDWALHMDYSDYRAWHIDNPDDWDPYIWQGGTYA
jgi:hypothetical protein